RLRRDVGVESCGDLVQQRAQPFGEHGQLLLLQQHAHQPAVGAGLQVERAVTWLPDRSGDEPVRMAEYVNDPGHGSSRLGYPNLPGMIDQRVRPWRTRWSARGAMRSGA